MDLGLADRPENSRIKAIAAVVASDEIHPIGDYNLLQVTPVTTRHRALCISDFLTGRRGHDDIACATVSPDTATILFTYCAAPEKINPQRGLAARQIVTMSPRVG